MSSNYNEMIEKDIELMWAIQDFCHKRPWIDNIMSRLVSRHPWNDVCAIIWLFFVYGIFEIGILHFWIVCTNLAGSFALRQLIKSKRPIEYDNRLKPLTDLIADSYGFPSLECHMSVVILGHFLIYFKIWLLLPLAILIISLVGFSRLYARSRFPHQVVGSWMSGFVGLFLAMQCCHQIGFHRMNEVDHYGCVGFVFCAIICNFGLSMESNDSRLISIPKKEFVNVLRNIMTQNNNSQGQGQGANGNAPLGMGEERDNNSLDAMAVQRQKSINATPRSLAAIRALEMEKENNANGLSRRGGGGGASVRAIRKDSFHFLQMTLEKRERETKEMKTGIRLGPSPRSYMNRYNINMRDDRGQGQYSDAEGRMGMQP